MRCPTGRSGFTLIELIVAVGIISVVIGLTLPAVQSARESARRSACQSNLHQIGLAINGYHQDFGCFPIGITTHPIRPIVTTKPQAPEYKPPDYYYGYYSHHSRLLPYLDQAAHYNAINFSTGTTPKIPRPYLAAINTANQTVIDMRVALFLCPSDGGPLDASGANYRGNVGVGPTHGTSIMHPDSNNGLIPQTGLVRAASVQDGLSHTAAFGERLRGSGLAGAPAPDRDFWWSRGYVSTADDQLKMCQIVARRDAKGVYPDAGRYWFWFGREQTLYCHGQTPNGPVPDCLELSVTTAPGMATARSGHPGGVNALMGDGSCRWVSSSINLAVWRALGTRSGGELVD
jgi:prepilin-type N-terminal cleavage/methylation domain-containing protein/prepilin-type processing-associated H-X9-DG protein